MKLKKADTGLLRLAFMNHNFNWWSSIKCITIPTTNNDQVIMIIE
jgi:hypothetical protein